MVQIRFISEIQNFDPEARLCLVLLHGAVFQDEKEIGRFFLDKKILIGKEYDLYVNQATQTIDEKFLTTWEETVLSPIKESIEKFEKELNMQTLNKQ